MPLPASPHQRALKHTRKVHVEFYLRDDELWDIEARFTDVKPFDLDVISPVIPANQPVHDFWVRLTTDSNSNIVEAIVVFDQVPFVGFCERIKGDYQKLIGLNVLKNFRQGVRERLGTTAGCTHMNELLEMLPYVAAQVLIFGEKKTREKTAFQQRGEKPFHLDGCHALRTDGPVVAQFYPNWVAEDISSQKEFS